MKKFMSLILVIAFVASMPFVAMAACTAALTTSYKTEILAGTHTSTDNYYVALYSGATMGAATTAYTVTSEVTGTGYTAGGKLLTGFTASASGTTAYIDFDNAVWSAPTTLTADCFMIYNHSKSDKAVMIGTFAAPVTSTSGTFTITWPAPGATAIIRLP